MRWPNRDQPVRITPLKEEEDEEEDEEGEGEEEEGGGGDDCPLLNAPVAELLNAPFAEHQSIHAT
jgi:hypothetical protein